MVLHRVSEIIRKIVPETLWVWCAKYYKQNLVYFGFIWWRFLHKGVNNVYEIPIIINNFNRLSYLKQLIQDLKTRGYNNIYIIDNKSSYPPLLDFYQQTDCKLFLLDKNVGYKALWETGIIKFFNNSFFVYTDSDVVLDKNCPSDFLNYLLQLAYKYPKAQKVGLGIHIDDLPNAFALKDSVIQHESQFWKKEIEPDIFDARIDTTFALYKPYFGSVSDRSQFNIRTGGVYMIHHMPWYVDSSALDEENQFYVDAINKSTHWSKQLRTN